MTRVDWINTCLSNSDNCVAFGVDFSIFWWYNFVSLIFPGSSTVEQLAVN